MPYPNFHAARVRDPNDFYRIVVLQTLSNGIMIYGGPLKSDPRGKSKTQAYRFPKNKFTVEQAKKWLKEHDIKIILFEPAKNTDDMPKTVRRFDYTNLNDGHIDTSTGFLVLPARATRTGVFKYRLADGSIFKELRLPEEVFAYNSMKSLEGKPLTNNHPPELVTVKNAKKYMVGYTSDKIDKEGEWVTTKAFVTDDKTIEDIVNKGKQQLSCGYVCELEMVTGNYMGEEYDAIQRNIRYNHIAVVDTARAGPEAKLKLDSSDGELINEDNFNEEEEYIKEEKMPIQKEEKRMIKIKIDGIEYEVEPIVAKQIEKLESDNNLLKSKLDEKENALKNITKEKDTIEAKSDALKAEMEEEKKKNAKKMDADEIKTAAKKRIEILDIADKVCDDETIKKLDEMDDIDIKKVIVKSKHDINLDEKSEDYINAFVDSVKADLYKKDDTKDMGDKIVKGRQNSDKSNDILKAKEESMKNDAEAWKKPLGR